MEDCRHSQHAAEHAAALTTNSARDERQDDERVTLNQALVAAAIAVTAAISDVVKISGESHRFHRCDSGPVGLCFGIC
jgi:hypothetical protein